MKALLFYGDHLIRDWDTFESLPDYEGPCIVCFPEGEATFYTFRNENGEREWILQQGSVNRID